MNFKLPKKCDVIIKLSNLATKLTILQDFKNASGSVTIGLLMKVS